MRWIFGLGAFAWAGLAIIKVGENLSLLPTVDLPVCTPFAFAVCAVWQFRLAVSP